MGERIRQARMEAGMSQRQLAGEIMTRNMLSALEHDSANPSIATLRYLSEKLCKPVGYFFGEEMSRGTDLGQAREFYRQGALEACLKGLEEVEDEGIQQEKKLLQTLCLLQLAEDAEREGKVPYSRTLLEECAKVMKEVMYLQEELERRWLIASAKVDPRNRGRLLQQIRGVDEVLLLRAETALEDGQTQKAGRMLDAVENQKSAQWNFLQAEVYFKQGDYENAVRHYHLVEQEMNVNGRLEICYRELGDFKMAYYYVKQKK